MLRSKGTKEGTKGSRLVKGNAMETHRAVASRSSAAVLTCLALFLSGCMPQSQNAGLLKQWNSKCKEAADLLAGVKDVPAAKAAEPRLAKLLAEMDKVQAELDRKYDPSDVDPSEERAVTEQVGEGVVQMQRLVAETVRIGKDPHLTAALGDAWTQLPSKGLLDATGIELQSP